MRIVLDIAWTIVSLIRYGSLGVVLTGVVVFGWNFVGINARAAQTDSGTIPVESWRGPGARAGAKLVALGFALLAASFLLAALLPPRL
jgi:hypothetical protein